MIRYSFIIFTFASVLITGCSSAQYVYEGRATDCSQYPISGAEFLAIGAEWHVIPYPVVIDSAKTDTEGKFRIETQKKVNSFINVDDVEVLSIKNHKKHSRNNCG
ncbi:hypothetical protein [Reinekea sp. G2M2-21]|uniref:hypothetical protein n=1 Tax=Reinekea sp. G2M2-21 TaxID=2788942 RepID=UPI0018A9F581|nr:hypothetical protein [Reinekea sp. G2M2-21]